MNNNKQQGNGAVAFFLIIVAVGLAAFAYMFYGGTQEATKWKACEELSQLDGEGAPALPEECKDHIPANADATDIKALEED